MGFAQRMRGTVPAHKNDMATNGSNTPPNESEHADLEKEAGQSLDNGPVHVFTLRVFVMGVIVSIGGMIFGYDTGQISGFLEMSNFLELFGDTTKDGKPAFSNTRSGTIVALVCLLFALIVSLQCSSEKLALNRNTYWSYNCCTNRRQVWSTMEYAKHSPPNTSKTNTTPRYCVLESDLLRWSHSPDSYR
jgi:hypothetical protein